MGGWEVTDWTTSDLERRLGAALDAFDGPIASAYLFGSHAEGRSHRESDVDVGILLDRPRAPTRADRQRLREGLITHLIAALQENAIDVVVLNDAPPQLGRAIVTRGRRVLYRDEAQDHAYVRDVQLRAADIEPFLRRTRRLKLESFAR